MGKRKKRNSRLDGAPKPKNRWGAPNIWEEIFRQNPLTLLKFEIYKVIRDNNPNYFNAVRQLLLLNFEEGEELEICNILLDCCGKESTYFNYYGNIADLLCDEDVIHVENFEKQLIDQYYRIVFFEVGKILNIATFFGHLLARDAISWRVLRMISLREKDLTEKSRFFLEIVFRELANSGVQDMYEHFWRLGIYTSTPRDTRIAIRFFTSIGLDGITENLWKRLERGKYVIRPRIGRLKLHNLDSSSSSSESASDEDSDDESGKQKRKGKTTIQLGDN